MARTKKKSARTLPLAEAHTRKTILRHLAAGTLTLRVPAPESARIHTPLTLDDRDAVDLLHTRIKQHALLVQYTLSTRDEVDVLDDRDQASLTDGLIELCESIVTDTHALHEVLTVAAKRTGGA